MNDVTQTARSGARVPDGRPRLLVLSQIAAEIVKPSREEFDVLMRPTTSKADADVFLAREGPGVEVMLSAGGERVGADLMDQLPDLKAIVVMAAGIGGIEFEAARARGVAVTNAGDSNAEDCADFALALFLGHRREVVYNDQYVRAGLWASKGRRPSGLAVGDDRVGVVGLGNIGKAVMRRLEPFGCELAWWGPRPKPDVSWARHGTLEDLAEWATTLIVTAVGDNSTRGLISAEVIEKLGPDGLLINISRGFVVDEPALIAALKDGRLGGAALDVLEKEPNDGAGWLDVPNVVLAPHVAGSTRAASRRMRETALANIRAHFAGEPLRNRVD